MRQRWSQSAGDVDTIDVVLVEDEDETADEFLALLHELALEAIALRAGSPGDPRQEIDPAPPADPAADVRATTWLLRRLGKRRVAQLAVITAAALALAVGSGVVDARRAAARLAALVATPSVLEPAASPPVELWRVPGRVVTAQGETLLVASGQHGALQRIDPATGEVTWAVASPSDDATMAGDCVTCVDAGGRHVQIEPEEHVLPGGSRVTWSWDPDGAPGRGAVMTKDGGWAFALWGPPLVPPITDGSEPGTLVVMTADGDRLRGRDLRTGRNRWSLPYDGALPVRAVAQVDGVMLLDDGAAVTAIDVRTGGGLWRAQVASEVTRGSALIDGEVVLLPVRDGAAVQLAAVRIADGVQLWRAEMPAGTDRLAVVGHQLIASTGDSVVGLG